MQYTDCSHASQRFVGVSRFGRLSKLSCKTGSDHRSRRCGNVQRPNYACGRAGADPIVGVSRCSWTIAQARTNIGVEPAQKAAGRRVTRFCAPNSAMISNNPRCLFQVAL